MDQSTKSGLKIDLLSVYEGSSVAELHDILTFCCITMKEFFLHSTMSHPVLLVY